MADATENGLNEIEDWEVIQASPGHALGPLGQLEWDSETGEVRRAEGYESFPVPIRPPERPY